jgi:hypothetical protein
MQSHWEHKATELAPEERMLFERWLGRALSPDETVTVSAYRSRPSESQMELLRNAIIGQAHEIGARAGTCSEEEIDALLDEATAAVRQNRP